MHKFFILIAFILLSAGAATAQTAREEKPLASDVKRIELNAGAKRRAIVRVRDGRVLSLGPSTTYLKNGLTREEVLSLLGKPVERTEREEGGARLSTYTFARDEGRVLIAEFENDVLVNSRVEEKLAQSPGTGQ